MQDAGVVKKITSMGFKQWGTGGKSSGSGVASTDTQLKSLDGNGVNNLFSFLLGAYDDSFAWDASKTSSVGSRKKIIKSLRLMELGHLINKAEHLDPKANYRKVLTALDGVVAKLETRHGGNLYKIGQMRGGRKSFYQNNDKENQENAIRPKTPAPAKRPSTAPSTVNRIPSGKSLARTPVKTPASTRRPKSAMPAAEVVNAVSGDTGNAFKSGNKLARSPPTKRRPATASAAASKKKTSILKDTSVPIVAEEPTVMRQAFSSTPKLARTPVKSRPVTAVPRMQSLSEETTIPLADDNVSELRKSIPRGPKTPGSAHKTPVSVRKSPRARKTPSRYTPVATPAGVTVSVSVAPQSVSYRRSPAVNNLSMRRQSVQPAAIQVYDDANPFMSRSKVVRSPQMPKTPAATQTSPPEATTATTTTQSVGEGKAMGASSVQSPPAEQKIPSPRKLRRTPQRMARAEQQQQQKMMKEKAEEEAVKSKAESNCTNTNTAAAGPSDRPVTAPTARRGELLARTPPQRRAGERLARTPPGGYVRPATTGQLADATSSTTTTTTATTTMDNTVSSEAVSQQGEKLQRSPDHYYPATKSTTATATAAPVDATPLTKAHVREEGQKIARTPVDTSHVVPVSVPGLKLERTPVIQPVKEAGAKIARTPVDTSNLVPLSHAQNVSITPAVVPVAEPGQKLKRTPPLAPAPVVPEAAATPVVAVVKEPGQKLARTPIVPVTETTQASKTPRPRTPKRSQGERLLRTPPDEVFEQPLTTATDQSHMGDVIEDDNAVPDQDDNFDHGYDNDLDMDDGIAFEDNNTGTDSVVKPEDQVVIRGAGALRAPVDESQLTQPEREFMEFSRARAAHAELKARLKDLNKALTSATQRDEALTYQTETLGLKIDTMKQTSEKIEQTLKEAGVSKSKADVKTTFAVLKSQIQEVVSRCAQVEAEISEGKTKLLEDETNVDVALAEHLERKTELLVRLDAQQRELDTVKDSLAARMEAKDDTISRGIANQLAELRRYENEISDLQAQVKAMEVTRTDEEENAIAYKTRRVITRCTAYIQRHRMLQRNQAMLKRMAKGVAL